MGSDHWAVMLQRAYGSIPVAQCDDSAHELWASVVGTAGQDDSVDELRVKLPTVDVGAVVLLNQALMHRGSALWAWELTVLRSIDEIVAGVYPDRRQSAVVAEVAARAKRALLFEELRRLGT